MIQFYMYIYIYNIYIKLKKEVREGGQDGDKGNSEGVMEVLAKGQ